METLSPVLKNPKGFVKKLRGVCAARPGGGLSGYFLHKLKQNNSVAGLFQINILKKGQ